MFDQTSPRFDDLAIFGQKASQAVDLRGAELHQLLAHAVQRQDRLLLLGLDRNRLDAGLLHRRPDRACVVRIVLVTAHEGPNHPDDGTGGRSSAAVKLGKILHDMHHNAPLGEKEAAVHLFGIKCAEEIEEAKINGTPVVKIVKWAGIRYSLHTEVRKGMKLAKYVTVKPTPDNP